MKAIIASPCAVCEAYLDVPVVDGVASLFAVFSLAMQIAQTACNVRRNLQSETPSNSRNSTLHANIYIYTEMPLYVLIAVVSLGVVPLYHREV